MALTDNLISFWSLEEASGTRIDAVTATGNDLADNNTVTQQTGIVANCAQFTAANSENLSRADNASFSTADIDFSFCAWVYLDATTGIQTVFHKGVSLTGNNNNPYCLYKYTDHKVYFDVANNSGIGEAGSAGTLSATTWYFIVAWHDSVANTVNLSINDGTPASASWSGGSFDDAGTFRIGASTTVGVAAEFWNGRIDQFGFWKRVLTAADITQLYNGGAGLSYAAMQGGSAGGPIIGGAIRKGALIRGGRIVA